LKTGLHILVFFSVLFSYSVKAQIISYFTWDSNPVTTALVGPNATSVGSNASSTTGGVGGTNGLNPGLPPVDINLTIPNTGNVFDVASIDISVDYRRNESIASMFRRGVFISNNGAANFRVTYRVVTGTLVTTVTGTNVNIPQDNTFRNYRFTYDNCTGTGNMYVNNAVVWTSPTLTPNQNLYWVGDGNMIVGLDVDGAGNNIPALDNFLLQTFICGALPIELITFSGINYNNKNTLKWSTATETNNDYFTIEHSLNGSDWDPIANISGAKNSSSVKHYSSSFENPEKTINYYRLTQTDFDRQTKNSPVVVIDNSPGREIRVIKTLDLLGRAVGENYKGVIIVYYSDGTAIKTVEE